MGQTNRKTVLIAKRVVSNRYRLFTAKTENACFNLYFGQNKSQHNFFISLDGHVSEISIIFLRNIFSLLFLLKEKSVKYLHFLGCQKKSY